MKRYLLASILTFIATSGVSANTGSVGNVCVGLTVQQCVDWTNATYNTPQPPSQPPSPSAPTFAWKASGTISGMHCTKIVEGAQPPQYTWNDNYFCASQNIGMQWSSSGPISGKRCTQVYESAAPAAYTWDDNYLCLPQDSPVTFTWKASGGTSGLQCTQWLETADPYTWDDNYMCHTYTAPPPPEPVAPPPPPPPPPVYTLTVSNLQLDDEFGEGEHACLLYSYTIPGSSASGTESVKVFTAGWSEVSNEGTTAHFPTQVNERCANFTTPTTPGDYRAQVCLSVGSSICDDKEFSVVSSGGNPPGNGNDDITLHWYDTYDQSWSSANTFGSGDTIRVLFGAQNNEPTQVTFDADLKVFDVSGGYITTKSGSITMPAYGTKDMNGDDPRFTTSFTTPGSYQVQLCAGSSCKELKNLTITGSNNSGPNISINWWNNFSSSYSTPGTFAPGESIIVMFGGQNNEPYDATFDGELKVYDANSNYITTKTGSITMQASGTKDLSGNDPRFTTSFTNAGTYQVELCVGANCGSMKTITIQ